MSTKAVYDEPLHSLQQVLEETPDQDAALAYAVIVGPHYKHTSDATLVWKALTPSAELTYQLNDGMVVTATTGVDNDYTRVFVRDGQAQLWAGKDGDIYANLPGGKLLQFDTAFLNTGNAAVAQAFDQGRPPQPGDILTIDDGVKPAVTRKVVRTVGADVAATISSFEKYGANALVTTAATRVSSSVTWGGAHAVAALDANILSRWFRNFGIIGVHNGLRAILEIECLTPGSDADAATFVLRVNGVAVAGTVAQDTGDVVASFSLPGIVSVTEAVSLTAAYAGAWVAGNLVHFNLDFTTNAFAGVAASFFETSDLSGYNLGNGIRKTSGQLTYTVLSVAENGNVTFRLESLNGLALPQQIVMTSAADLLVTVAYDGGVIEFGLDSTVYALAYAGLRISATIFPPAYSTTVFDKVELDAITGLTGAVTVAGSYAFTGTLPVNRLSAPNYAVTGTEVTLDAPEVLVPAYPTASWRPLITGGEAAVVWRQIQLPTLGEQLITLKDQREINTVLGSDHPDSELGYGALCALIGAEGKEIKVLRTAGTTAADFRAALQRIENIRSAYSLGILTTDTAVMVEVVDHVRRMAGPLVKHFRRCYVGTDSPGEYDLIGVRPNSSPYLANILAGDNGFNLVSASDVDLDFTGVSVGDYLLVVAQGARYRITSVSPSTLTLESGPGTALTATSVKVIAADTSANTVKFVKARTLALRSAKDDDRRVVNAWNHKGLKLVGDTVVTQKMRFYACEAAGVRSVIAPHQGQSRRKVLSIDSSPGMYLQFSRTQLNELGAAGVWVVTQDSAGAKVYVRHQITAAVEGGLLFYEDSVGTNLDLICFEWDDVVDPKIGTVNANRRSRFNLKAELIDLLARLSTEEQTPDGRRLGPRIERFYNLEGLPDSVTMDLNANFKDQFDSGAILELPTPLNRVRSTVLGRAISGLDGEVVTTLAASTQA